MSDNNQQSYNRGLNGMGFTPGSSPSEMQAYNRGAEERRQKEAMERQQQQFHQDRMRQLQEDQSSVTAPSPVRRGGGASPVVWFFGAIGALIGAGYSISQESFWGIGAFLGFVGGGFLGGLLSKFKIGRVVLWIIGGVFVAALAYGIFFKG